MRLGRIILLSASLFTLTGCFSILAAASKAANEESTNSGTQYGFGDKVSCGDFEYVVNSATNRKRIGSSLLGKETENNFVIVNFTVKNTSSSEKNLYSSMMTYHIGENEYEVNSAGVYLDSGFTSLEDIGAQMSKTLEAVYEIPNEYSNNDYLLIKASAYSSKSVKIYMKTTI